MTFKQLFLLTLAASTLFFSCSSTSPVASDKPIPPYYSTNQIDSLFTVLITRIERLDTITTIEQYRNLNLNPIAAGFDLALMDYPDNVKANIGFIVAAGLSLGCSGSVTKLVDSIDAYVNGTEDYYGLLSGFSLPKKQSTPAPGKQLTSDLTNRYALQGLAAALVAQAPQLVLAQTQKPSWPRFVTLSSIQSVIETDLIPVLDRIIECGNHLNALPSLALPFVDSDGDTTTINKGDLLICMSNFYLLRGLLGVCSLYKCDLYTSATDPSMVWYNTYVDYLHQGRTIIARKSASDSTKMDTILYYTYSSKNAQDSLAYKLLKQNLSRANFMAKLPGRSSKIVSDLQAAPATLNEGLSLVRNCGANGNCGVININSMMSVDNEMVSLPARMIDLGISPFFADNFTTPETFANFMSDLFSRDYAYSYTSNGVTKNLTVNIKAFLQDTALSIKSLLPSYRWKADSLWFSSDTTDDSTITVRDSILTIASGTYELANANDATIKADSITEEIDTLTFTRPFGKIIYITRNMTPYPCMLTDSVDTFKTVPKLNLNIDSLKQARVFFPYFMDYTFQGLFPGMTRQKWLELCW